MKMKLLGISLLMISIALSYGGFFKQPASLEANCGAAAYYFIEEGLDVIDIDVSTFKEEKMCHFTCAVNSSEEEGNRTADIYMLLDLKKEDVTEIWVVDSYGKETCVKGPYDDCINS
jgi:hypothetical protein